MEQARITIAFFFSAILVGPSPLYVESLSHGSLISNKLRASVPSPPPTYASRRPAPPPKEPSSTVPNLQHHSPPPAKTKALSPPVPPPPGFPSPPPAKSKALSPPVPPQPGFPSPPPAKTKALSLPVPPPPGFPSHYRPSTAKSEKGKPEVNIGKKIGLLFLVVVGFLHVGVVLFLGIKRWQILKMEKRAS